MYVGFVPVLDPQNTATALMGIAKMVYVGKRKSNFFTFKIILLSHQG
jgi:hypothetical protein